MKKELLISVFLFGTSTLAFAQSSPTGFESVNDISVSGSGNIRVDLSGATVNPAGCPQSDYLITPDSSSQKLWLAQLMTAKAADQTVRLRIDNSVCGNGGNSPRITQVEVR